MASTQAGRGGRNPAQQRRAFMSSAITFLSVPSHYDNLLFSFNTRDEGIGNGSSLHGVVALYEQHVSSRGPHQHLDDQVVLAWK